MELHPVRAKEYVPSDTVDVNTFGPTYVGTCGDIKVTLYNGETVTFKNYQVGEFPYMIKRLWATGTTAGHFIHTWSNDRDWTQ